MRRKIVLKIIFSIAAFALVVIVLTKVVIEPWIEKKIQASLNEEFGDYQLKIEIIG